MKVELRNNFYYSNNRIACANSNVNFKGETDLQDVFNQLGADLSTQSRYDTPKVVQTGAGKTSSDFKTRKTGVNFCDENGITPLMSSICAENFDEVKALCSIGADVNQFDNDGNTPIHHVAKIGNVEIAEFLKQQGADLTIRNKDGQLASDLTNNWKIKKTLKAN